MDAKGLRVNAGKTKVMQCRVSRFQSEDSGKLKSNVDFHCRRCLEGNNGLFQSVLLREVVMEPNVKLECVSKFCYLGDTLGARGGVEGNEDTKSAKSGEDGTDDSEMDVWDVAEG